MKSQGHPGSQLQLLKYGPVIRHSAMSPPPVWEQPGILDLGELRVNRHEGGSDPGNGCDQPITRAEPLEEQLLDWISDFKPDDEPCTRELVDGLRCNFAGADRAGGVLVIHPRRLDPGACSVPRSL